MRKLLSFLLTFVLIISALSTGELLFIDAVTSDTAGDCALSQDGSTHKYDSDCDAICNLCGDERLLLSHTYDYFNICNVCGYNKILEYIKYEISYFDYSAIITGCNTNISGKYAIPSKIDGYPVVGIADGAFANCSKLTNIEIPSSIKEIGCYAFSGAGLTSFYSQASDSYNAIIINQGAFSGCKNLAWIFLEYGATVGADAFYDCTNLKSVYLGKNHGWSSYYCCTIDDSSFTNVNATAYYLKGTTIDYETKTSFEKFFKLGELNSGVCGNNLFWRFDEENNTLFISGKGNFSHYISGTQAPWFVYADDIENIVILDGITYIPSYTFEYQTNVKTVTLPNTLNTLALNAFNDCSNLNNLLIPESLKSIDSNTYFNRCDSLTDLYYLGTKVEWNKIVNANLVFNYDSMERVNCLTYHEKINPTCIQDGTDAYYSFEDSKISNIYDSNKNKIAEIPLISAQGHRYGEVCVYGPQYDAEGYSTHTCTVCGYEEKFDFVPALVLISGDISGDGNINGKDCTALLQYINGWNVDVFVDAADLNTDGKLNNKDYILLVRYLNGWDVEFK